MLFLSSSLYFLACVAAFPFQQEQDAQQHAWLATSPLDRLPSSQKVPSGDSQVARCIVKEAQQSRLLADLIALESLDVWSNENMVAHEPIDIAVSSMDVLQVAIEEGIECRLWIESVQGLIHTSSELVVSPEEVNALSDSDKYFTEYHSFDDLVGHVKRLSEEYPKLTTFVSSIGKTHENRDIPVVHITATAKPKKKVWFNGGIHAREWISSHVATYLVTNLLEQYGKDEKVTKALDQFEFIVAPHINPDGYEYSRNSYRMWRKNRRKNNGNSYGVDLNRNFDILWGRGGSSSSPESDTYRGPRPASEPEVSALQNYIRKLGEIAVSIDFHSYGQLLMRPYGYTMVDHPHEKRTKALGDAMRDTIKEVSGASYSSQKSAGLYPVTGGFDDWMTEVVKTIGFTIELRDRGRYGFALPPREILPTCQEIWSAFMVLTEKIQDW